MIWHPWVWSFWAAAATGSLLYAAAAWRAVDVAANWAPMQTDGDQLRRERAAEMAALLGRGALVCLAAAAAVGLTGIALIWHRIIPGAMCGTGVLQAMGPAGHRAMLLWGTTLLLMYGWRVMNGLDARQPEGLLIAADARLLLTAAPFLTLALVYAWQSLMRVDGAPPVSCCAAVYDRVLGSASEAGITAALARAALWGSLAGTVGLPLAVRWASGRTPPRTPGGAVAATCVCWCVLAGMSVKHVWSAYYYQVLSHPCPWCLFLPDHRGAGFLIFSCLATVCLEGVAFWIAAHVRRTCPPLATSAKHRLRRAGWRILVAVAGFTLLAIAPAVVWRLQNGVWMTGAT